MLQEISYYLIYGIPFIVYLGLVTLFLFVITALFAVLKRRGMLKMHIKWHFWLAYLSIALAVVHGFLGLAVYL